MRGFPQTTCLVDWMADTRTSQCPKFVSDRPLPASTLAAGPTQIGVDILALSASLPAWSPGWLNPPWNLIPHVLKLVLNCPGATALVVVPTMESKAGNGRCAGNGWPTPTCKAKKF